MKRCDLVLLVMAGLAVALCVAAMEPAPGYMDADYYYAGGLQLADGNGFSEPYLWNYLDDPASLPHPSHGYWMPLASILSAIFPAILAKSSWFVDRIPFILMSALIPAVTAILAEKISGKRRLGVVAGLLAIFSGFYLPYLVTTDTFSITMLLGGCFLWVSHGVFQQNQVKPVHLLMLGGLSGLMHLTRTEGMIWLVLAYGVVLLNRKKEFLPSRVVGKVMAYGFPLAGYLLVMLPWFLRNQVVFGTLLAPGGAQMFWLTSYDQIFSYPAGGLTPSAWWQAGLAEIVKSRFWALGMNAATMFGVQGGVFLLPFSMIGAWQMRKERTIQISGLAWLFSLTLMTVVFPFAGARGGFFHSGAAVQMTWWVLAPFGLEKMIAWGIAQRGWKEGRARRVFFAGLLGMAVLLSGMVLILRIPTWGEEAQAYTRIGSLLREEGLTAEDVVIVANPPGFYLVTGNGAIAVPAGNEEALRAVALRYGADYLVLEADSTPAGLRGILENPEAFPWLEYFGEEGNASVFSIHP